tara:strand:+ start:23996 stop:24718 length:723 start_codon:yes stop_codon:yes gene_type:complete
MQPTYMPWLGYFDLIDQADHFVFLDDVQLARQSWQTRNRIRGADGRELMLSIPVRHGGKLDIALHEVELDDRQPWRLKHGRSVQQAYARAPFGHAAAAIWTKALELQTGRLTGLTCASITQICSRVGITTPLAQASRFTTSADRIGHLIDLCRATGADTYLSPPGASTYLTEADAQARFAQAGIALRFHKYDHPAYAQGPLDFMSHLGIVDALAHVGVEGMLALIRSGRQPATRVAHLAA